MYYKIEYINNINKEFIAVITTITLRWLLAASASHFGGKQNSKILTLDNPGFVHLKHLQNPRNLLLTALCM